MPAVSSSPVRLGPVAAGWAAAVTGVAVAGGIGADTSSDWYRDLDKPSWQPSGAVFGPVWTALYVLIAIAALIWLIWPHNRAAALALAPYGAWVTFAAGLTWTIAARN